MILEVKRRSKGWRYNEEWFLPLLSTFVQFARLATIHKSIDFSVVLSTEFGECGFCVIWCRTCSHILSILSTHTSGSIKDYLGNTFCQVNKDGSSAPWHPIRYTHFSQRFRTIWSSSGRSAALLHYGHSSDIHSTIRAVREYGKVRESDHFLLSWVGRDYSWSRETCLYCELWWQMSHSESQGPPSLGSASFPYCLHNRPIGYSPMKNVGKLKQKK